MASVASMTPVYQDAAAQVSVYLPMPWTVTGTPIGDQRHLVYTRSSPGGSGRARRRRRRRGAGGGLHEFRVARCRQRAGRQREAAPGIGSTSCPPSPAAPTARLGRRRRPARRRGRRGCPGRSPSPATLAMRSAMPASARRLRSRASAAPTASCRPYCAAVHRGHVGVRPSAQVDSQALLGDLRLRPQGHRDGVVGLEGKDKLAAGIRRRPTQESWWVLDPPDASSASATSTAQPSGAVTVKPPGAGSPSP